MSAAVPNLLEQCLAAVADRSASAVISQSAFASEPLRRYLRELLSQPAGIGESFLADPVFEASFGWQAAEVTMAQLEGRLLDPALVAALDDPPTSDPARDKYRFGRDWHPYLHQLEAWNALTEKKARSVLVSSGTGSGKTECFLVPVLNDLARQRRERRRLRGIQAIFLYPLNALINSQRDRLTDWTTAFAGDIRFCLYNGNTPEEMPEAEQRKRPSEVLSRKNLRRDPPPILVTNITMLEYMLVRTVDTPIIEQSKGALRWIILDEAHTYIGSQAAEIALLLRRVMRAFGVSSSEVRIVATSATIGDAEEADASLCKFLSDLAGVPEDGVILIKGARSVPPLPASDLVGGLPDARPLAALQPDEVYGQLAASKAMRRLREQMVRDPLTLAQAGKILGDAGGGGSVDRSTALRLLEQGARAQRGPDRFLPLRVHLFHRAQPGVWACINPDCRGRSGTPLDTPDWPHGRAFAREVERCADCGAAVFEVTRCTNCETPFLSVEETEDGLLRPARHVRDVDEFAQDVEPVAVDDESTEGEPDGEAVSAAAKRLVVRSGLAGTEAVSVDPKTARVLDAPQPGAVAIGLADVAQCPACGAVDYGKQDLFRGAQFGAPFLLGNVVPQLLEFTPPRGGPAERVLPADGRQIITFTDSRQGTARFAAKLQQDAERNFVRSAIYQIIHAAASQGASAGDIAELETELLKLKTAIEIPAVREIYEQKLKKLEQLRAPPAALPWREVQRHLADNDGLRIWMRDLWEDRDTGFADASRLAELQLYREFLRRPRLQNSAETMGLACLRFDEIERLGESSVPELFRDRGRGFGDWQDFLYLIVTQFLRSYSAVAIDRQLLRWLGTGIRLRRVKEPGGDAARDQYEIPWPRARSGAQTNRVLRLLALGLQLDLDTAADRDRANECLDAAWMVIGRLRDVHQADFRLDLTKAKIGRVDVAWLCPVTRTALDRTCFGYTPYLPLGTWPFDPRCERVEMPALPFPWRRRDGEPVSIQDVRDWLARDERVRTARDKGIWTNLHDRIAAVAPYVRSAEHSAQLPPARLRRYEEQFKTGNINVLCCSTTMEMGVDIGGISTVVMTNVPPAPANYRQRVGRAGRRGEAIALGLTFCKDDPLGWTVFRNPTWPFHTSIRPPAVSLDSPVIVQRHVNALLLSAFLKGVPSRTRDILKLEAGWFFKPEDPAKGENSSPADGFRSWCENATGLPPDVSNDLQTLIAGTCLEGRADLQAATAESVIDLRDSWRREWQALRDDIETIPQSDESARKALQLQMQRIEGNYLLSELATRGFLPGYGFPTDVVAFVNTTASDARRLDGTRQREDNRLATRSYPSRQLDIAIRDYAPGADVVVDGLVYRSAGITLNWKRPASESAAREVQAIGFAWRCDNCGITDSSTRLPECCSACGGAVKSMSYLRPAGFAVDVRDEPHTDTAQVTYLAPVQPWISARGGNWTSLPVADVGRYRMTRLGHVFHYARGAEGHGYAVCLHCGRAAAEHGPGDESPHVPKEITNHKPLRAAARTSDGLCPGLGSSFGIRRHLALGYGVTTDVFELQLQELDDPATATSIAVAAREALARKLGIETAELGWAAVRTRGDRRQACYSIFLYDRAAGGAGFSSAAAAFLPEVLNSAADILDCTNPDCLTCCHACILMNDTRFEADRLDRRPALSFLKDKVLKHLTLPAELAFFGPTSRAETRPLVEGIDAEMARRPDAALRVWIGGAPAGWDFEGWPGRALIEKWGLKGRRVRLIAVEETLATLTFGQKLVLHGLLERCRTKLFAVQRLPGARAGSILAEVRSAQSAIAWASGAAAARIPRADWGRGAAVVLGRMETAPLAARPVPLNEIFPEDAVRADLLRVTSEANGPIDSFGPLFWTFVLARKPEIGQLVRSGTPAQIIYQDRYLFSPLTARLLQEILRPLAPKKDEKANVMVRTLAAKAGLAPSAPTLLFHDWESAQHRDYVLRALVERLAFACRLETRRLQELSHDRTLQIQWQGGGNVVVHLDQGLGFWTARQRLLFPFTARPEIQLAELAKVRFDVMHRQSQPMPIFILDVQVGNSRKPASRG